MPFNLLASKEFIKEFFKDTTKGMLLLCVVAISVLFTFLYKNQEGEKAELRKQNTKCETKNYLQDVDIKVLLAGKAKSDSLVNRIMGRLEAIEELKKINHEVSNSNLGTGGGRIVQ